MRTPRWIAVAAAGLMIGLSLAACGEDDNDDAKKSDKKSSAYVIEPEGTGDPFVDSRTAASHMPMTAQALATGLSKAANVAGDSDSAASDLRTSLTALLQEHAYLAGIAVATAYATSPDSAEFKAAADVVNANADDVAAAVASVGGKEAGEQFGIGFKSHIQDFVNYAVGAKTNDEAKKKTAVDNLTAYARTQGEFWNTATGGVLPAADVEAAFNEHIGGVAKAVDAFAAGELQGYDLLREAAHHMPMMAQTLAGGVVTAKSIDGDPNDAAATLRADLTALLQEHVYLAGIAVFTAYTNEGGTDSEAFKSAAATLDANSVDLSKAVGSLAGAENEATFLQTWRDHISNFVDYANGAATNDEDAKKAAIRGLDAYRGTAGGFFEEVSGGQLKADAVASELKTHIASLAGAIDSMAGALVKK